LQQSAAGIFPGGFFRSGDRPDQLHWRESHARVIEISGDFGRMVRRSSGSFEFAARAL
jgi:hypothetical protein